MNRDNLTNLEVRSDIEDAFIQRVDHRLAGSVWNTGGCSSCYLNQTGRNVTFWPGFNRQYRHRTRHIKLADFIAT